MSLTIRNPLADHLDALCADSADRPELAACAEQNTAATARATFALVPPR